jgi:hypothetical protein
MARRKTSTNGITFNGESELRELINRIDINSHYTFTHYMSIYMSTFKWIDLPDTVNERALEHCLFNSGKVAFIKDGIGKEIFLTLPCSTYGSLNQYGEPEKISVYGMGTSHMFNKQFTCDNDAVIIYDNYARISPQYKLLTWSCDVDDIDNTKRINRHMQKTPFLIRSSKELEHTIRTVLNQYDNNKKAIVTDKDFDLNALQAIDLHVPYLLDKLQQDRKATENDIFNFIGIDNNTSDKRERLNSAEIDISTGHARASLNDRLQSRLNAIEKINKLFNLNIKIKINNEPELDNPLSDSKYFISAYSSIEKGEENE